MAQIVLSAFPSLFKIEPNTQELIIDNDTLLMCKEFEFLWRKRYTCKGDYDGSKKLMNEKIFKYISSFMGYNAIYAGLSDKDKHLKIVDNIGLKKGWEPDQAVINAMIKYREILDSYIPSNKVVTSMKAALFRSGYSLDSYTKQMDLALEAINKNLETVVTDGLNADALTVLNEANTLLQNNLNSIMSIGVKLPTIIQRIDELQSTIQAEESSARELLGGRKKGRREDPRQH
jgi:hypothetical protein